MKDRRPIGIILISLFMFILPWLVWALGNWAALSAQGEIVPLGRYILKAWPWLLFNSLLCAGIWRRNKAAWIVAIIFSAWNLIEGPLGLAVNSGFAAQQLNGQHGMLLSAWTTVLLVSLPYAIVAGYLLRPDVKKLFLQKGV
jgi:hypothetical protein